MQSVRIIKKTIRLLSLRIFGHNKKPVRKPYGFGGSGWIRTTEAKRNRFTVCPLWPLGNTPILNLRKNWSWWTDSTPRPADYKSAALPTELHQLVCFISVSINVLYYIIFKTACQEFFKTFLFFSLLLFSVLLRRDNR